MPQRRGQTRIRHDAEIEHSHAVNDTIDLNRVADMCWPFPDPVCSTIACDNDATPVITVDPETYAVTADGELLVCEPAAELPMAQRYFLF